MVYRSFFMCLRRFSRAARCIGIVPYKELCYIGCKISVGWGLAPAGIFMHIHIQKTAPDDPRRSFMDSNFYFSTTLPPLLAEA